MRQSSTTNCRSCDEIRENLSAQFDGEELTIGNTEIQQHLVHCTECAIYKSALKTLHSRLCQELAPTCDSDEIWNSVQLKIQAEEATFKNDPGPPDTAIELSPPRRAARRLMIYSLAASLLLGLVVSGVLILQNRHTGLPLAAETIRDYETFRIRGSQLDYTVDNSEALVKWMTGKVNFTLPEQVNPPARFQVAGGRICSFLNRRLAFFYYEKDAQSLSLYVMKAKGLSIPNKGEVNASTDANGLTTVTWKHNELAYVIVSDLPPADVMKFAIRT